MVRVAFSPVTYRRWRWRPTTMCCFSLLSGLCVLAIAFLRKDCKPGIIPASHAKALSNISIELCCMGDTVRSVYCYCEMRHPAPEHASFHKSNAYIHNALLPGLIRDHRYMHCCYARDHIFLLPSRLCLGQTDRGRQMHRPTRLCTIF